MKARPVVYTNEVMDGCQDITPDSKFVLSSFDGVKFNFIGEQADFKGKIIFESCHFESCEGLPSWITAVAQRSIIHTTTLIVFDADMNTMDVVYKNKNVVMVPYDVIRGKYVESCDTDKASESEPTCA